MKWKVQLSQAFVTFLGHRAATICLIIANRINGDASADYHSYMNKLIRYTLEKLS